MAPNDELMQGNVVNCYQIQCLMTFMNGVLGLLSVAVTPENLHRYEKDDVFVTISSDRAAFERVRPKIHPKLKGSLALLSQLCFSRGFDLNLIQSPESAIDQPFLTCNIWLPPF